jgi:hypothetical protein
MCAFILPKPVEAQGKNFTNKFQAVTVQKVRPFLNFYFWHKNSLSFWYSRHKYWWLKLNPGLPREKPSILQAIKVPSIVMACYRSFGNYIFLLKVVNVKVYLVILYVI